MASSSQAKAPSKLILWAGPVALVLLLYNFRFHSDAQRQITSSLDRLATQQKQDVSDAQLNGTLREAAALRSQLDQLDDRIETLVQERLAFAGKAQATPLSATEIVAQLSHWCEDHHLTVDRHTTEATTGSGPATNRLKRLAQLPAGHDFSAWLANSTTTAVSLPADSVNVSNPQPLAGRLCRLYVRGTYVDMRRALDDLDERSLPVWPISIEMQSDDLQQSVREWVVTLWF